MPTINKYKYLTNEEIDKYSAMDNEDFKAELEVRRSNLIRGVIQFSDIDKNRPFLIGVKHEDAIVMGCIYVRRDDNMYEITPYGETERRISLHGKFERVMYLDDKRGLTELEMLLQNLAHKPQGGFRYCNHEFTTSPQKCPHCGAMTK